MSPVSENASKNYVLSSLWVTLSATLGVQPLVMVYFNQISLISPVANLILIPLVGLGWSPGTGFRRNIADFTGHFPVGLELSAILKMS